MIPMFHLRIAQQLCLLLLLTASIFLLTASAQTACSESVPCERKTDCGPGGFGANLVKKGIPQGVYTNLNYAFGSTDPTTFEIIPGFSILAASVETQSKFFASLISFMSTYDFDGVEIDWEDPVGTDRGGTGADFENLPTFLRNLKSALSGTSRDGLTITLPTSYWYRSNLMSPSFKT
ncbi:hypothetical protein MKZ38_006152 [Zalerion maritima]|uniref:GH18 domain-containing protein n=1 Tax=Zalerion maritima TaxID=339359 RepID=A0AAD5RJA2_9PEZI|nr:hypothetical protein MKZ38_006152 [Zalerion maritima]